MLQLLSTPTHTLPLSPAASPPLAGGTAPLPATSSTTTAAAAAAAALGGVSSDWRPYHSHIARLVMTLPGLKDSEHAATKRGRRMSFSLGGSGAGASQAGDMEYVCEGTVNVFEDKIDFLLQSEGGAVAPFVRPLGSSGKTSESHAQAPLSPPSSPETRKKRLSFANILPAGLFGGGKSGAVQKDEEGDHSALDLEEHPDLGPGGIRQLRMKSPERPKGEGDRRKSTEGGVVQEQQHAQQLLQERAQVPEERAHLDSLTSKWPLFVNGAPLAQISVPLHQLTPSSLSVTSSRAMSADKSTFSVNRSPAAVHIHIPATDGAKDSVRGSDIYDGVVDLKIEFTSAFSGDTEASTLNDVVQHALERLGIKPADSLSLTRTISRGLTGGGRRKSSFGGGGGASVGAGEQTRAQEEEAREADLRAKGAYYDAMRYQ